MPFTSLCLSASFNSEYPITEIVGVGWVFDIVGVGEVVTVFGFVSLEGETIETMMETTEKTMKAETIF